MKLQTNGNTVPYLGITIMDDIWQYYSHMDVVLPYRLPTDTFTVIDSRGSVKMRVLTSEFQGQAYSYVTVPEDTYNLLNSTFEPIEGNFTVKQILSKVGAKNDIAVDSVASYWRIPQCKLGTLFSYLSNYATFPNGGGARFYIDIVGCVHCVDLKKAYSGRESSILLDVQSDRYTADWIIDYPGVVDMYVYSAENVCSKSTLTFKKGYGKGVCEVNDTTGHEADMMKSLLRNSFYTRYYTARELRANATAEGVVMGGLMNVNGVGKFIVTGRNLVVTPNMPNSMSVILSGPYENN